MTGMSDDAFSKSDLSKSLLWRKPWLHYCSKTIDQIDTMTTLDGGTSGSANCQSRTASGFTALNFFFCTKIKYLIFIKLSIWIFFAMKCIEYFCTEINRGFCSLKLSEFFCAEIKFFLHWKYLNFSIKLFNIVLH